MKIANRRTWLERLWLNSSVHIKTTKYHNSTDHNLFRAFESVLVDHNHFNAIFCSVLSFSFFINASSIFDQQPNIKCPEKEFLIQRKWVEVKLMIPTYLLHSWNSYECRFWAKPDQLFKLPEFVKYQTHSYATKRRLLLRKWNLIRIPQFQPNRLQHNRVNSNLK
mgnify:CR=1 FL=1